MNKKFIEMCRLLEYSCPDIDIGDTILVGRWRNSPAEVKGFGKDKNKQPTVRTTKGAYNLYKFRIQKYMPKKKETVKESIDYNKYLLFTPESLPGCEYYGLEIPGFINPPVKGERLILKDHPVVVFSVKTPDDIARGRGGPVAKSMERRGIGYAVNCLPEGHERLKNINLV